MKEPVEVEILGQRFTVASSDGAGHVRDVAKLVDDQMRRLVSAHVGASTLQLALLAALNIGSELAKLQSQVDALDESIQRLSKLIETDVGA